MPAMTSTQPKNPLHGITLKAVLESLVTDIGWETLGTKIKIKCFTDTPSINSSLVFLRKTPWARSKVEDLYLRTLRVKAKKQVKSE